MDRPSEKEKLSRKYRDERERERDINKDNRDRDRHRDHKHRSSRDDEDYHHSDKHRSSRDEKHYHRSDREYKRERSHEPRYDREGSKDRDRVHQRERSHEPRIGREGSRDRDLRSYERTEREGSRDRVYDRQVKPERSYDGRSERAGSRERIREDSMERSHLHKRKDRGGSEDVYDGDEKRARVLDGTNDDRKERRRFDDGKDLNGVEREEKRERRRFDGGVVAKEEGRERRKFGDRVKQEDDLGGIEEGKQTVKKEPANEQFDSEWSNTKLNGNALEPFNAASRNVAETYLPPSHPPTKVSSIYTNENKGVSITRSHEVPGKSSTDGSSSTAGKSGLSLDVLAKARKTLQKHKEMSEKMKNFPLLNKVGSSSPGGASQVGSKEGAITSSGILSGPPQSSVPTGATSIFSSSATTSANGMAALAGLTNIPNIEAVKRAQELAAKMGFHQDPEFAPIINMFPGQPATELPLQQKPAKVPVLRLDALGREIDEQGNVINLTKPNNLSTLKVNINKQRKDLFFVKPELEVDPEANPHFDARMGINKGKLLRPKRSTFQFVEEGKWSKDAEIIKLKSQFGEAQAKELRAKQAQLTKAKAEPDINPNLIEVAERAVVAKEKPKDPIPEIEWWDVPLLHSGATYADVAGDDIIYEGKLNMNKVTIYVEHPRPIEPPLQAPIPPPQPLPLTKKEQKKLRTQRRLAREKDRQELIRQGLIEPPKEKVKMSNLMKVLGSEATQDPTGTEMRIRSAAAEREQAHVDRNIARKLTPAERREKKERKLFDDPNTVETFVSIYKINSLSHPQTKFKVDINAQENRLSGCVVILEEGISVVVVEGGSKSIKRYGKLMLRRIDWASAVEDRKEDEDENEKPVNSCLLVWQGTVAKPSFHRFMVHTCRTEAAARKIFSDAGVGHYWDLAVNFTEDQM